MYFLSVFIHSLGDGIEQNFIQWIYSRPKAFFKRCFQILVEYCGLFSLFGMVLIWRPALWSLYNQITVVIVNIACLVGGRGCFLMAFFSHVLVCTPYLIVTSFLSLCFPCRCVGPYRFRKTYQVSTGLSSDTEMIHSVSPTDNGINVLHQIRCLRRPVVVASYILIEFICTKDVLCIQRYTTSKEHLILIQSSTVAYGFCLIQSKSWLSEYETLINTFR